MRKRNRERERTAPFNKMTTRVKPVVLRKFNMADHKSSAGSLVLEIRRKWVYYFQNMQNRIEQDEKKHLL